MNEKRRTQLRAEKWRNNWTPFLNIAQLVDLELEIARTCQQLPVKLVLGRKQWYEVKRDWMRLVRERPSSATDSTPQYLFQDILVELADATDRLVLVTRSTDW